MSTPEETKLLLQAARDFAIRSRRIHHIRRYDDSFRIPRATVELDLYASYMTTKHAENLAVALQYEPLPRLKRLLLGGNTTLGDAGVRALCKAFAVGRAPNIEVLRLYNNGLSDKSAQVRFSRRVGCAMLHYDASLTRPPARQRHHSGWALAQACRCVVPSPDPSRP